MWLLKKKNRKKKKIKKEKEVQENEEVEEDVAGVESLGKLDEKLVAAV